MCANEHVQCYLPTLDLWPIVVSYTISLEASNDPP